MSKSPAASAVMPRPRRGSAVERLRKARRSAALAVREALEAGEQGRAVALLEPGAPLVLREELARSPVAEELLEAREDAAGRELRARPHRVGVVEQEARRLAARHARARRRSTDRRARRGRPSRTRSRSRRACAAGRRASRRCRCRTPESRPRRRRARCASSRPRPDSASARVRQCTVSSAAPPASTARASSSMRLASSTPARIFAVTGVVGQRRRDGAHDALERRGILEQRRTRAAAERALRGATEVEVDRAARRIRPRCCAVAASLARSDPISCKPDRRVEALRAEVALQHVRAASAPRTRARTR